MSLSSESRKESTESYASQARGNVMGVPPALGQLYDRQLENENMSRKAYSDDVDATDDYEDAKEMAAENNNDDVQSEAEIEEAKRASWGQPPADAEVATIDDSQPMTAYQPEPGPGEDVNKVHDADWNRSTEEGSMAPSSADEPDRTVGNA